MKVLKCFFVLLLLSSCGTIIHYDYEKSTDFSQYKTYAYFSDMENSLSPLDLKRLMDAIDIKLKTIGLERSDNPDFYIDIQSQDIQNQNNSVVGVGMGGTGRNIGGGISVGLPLNSNKITKEIVIDFVDDTKGGMFWQAVSEVAINQNAKPEKREALFNALVEKIFEKYPPEQ